MTKKVNKEQNEEILLDSRLVTITSPQIYQVTIKGEGAILFNKAPDLSIPKSKTEKREKRDPIENEHATWREKAYFESDGMLFIPGENIHQALKEGAQYWGAKIPGEGNKTYTDLIHSAVIASSLSLGVHKDSEHLIPFGKSVNGNPSKGKKSGSKVYKIRPLLWGWGGTFELYVYDARLTPSVLQTIIMYAGAFRGLCDWRPTYGRFTLTAMNKS
jgi:hypothetical protein